MTPDEARRILARRPDWVRRAGCDDVEHYIRTHLNPGDAGKLLPHEDPFAVAREILFEFEYEAASRGEETIPVSAEEMAAYLIVHAVSERPAPKPFLKLSEVCRRLNISQQTAVRLIKCGELIAHRIGNQWRVAPEVLEAYLHRTLVAPRVARPLSRYQLLCLPYDELTPEERVNACAIAREVGAKEAQADRAAGGCGPEGVEQPTADAETYYHRVVESAFQAGEIGKEVADFWRWRYFRVAEDPRVVEFCRGWAARVQQYPQSSETNG